MNIPVIRRGPRGLRGPRDIEGFRAFRGFRAFPAALVLTAAAGVFSAHGQNRSPAEVFAAYDEQSARTADHSAWDGLIGRYLDSEHPSGVNRFDYAAVSPGDRRVLDEYLDEMQSLSPASLNRDEQMAYWFNLYNALTVRVILDHYPVASIRDISLPGSRGGPWKAALVTVEGRPLSLDNIEHDILRPLWGDPRIHYAVNCASIGCPDLAPRAYRGAILEEMLDEAARSYINHPRGVSSDGRRLTLSSIYSWYKEDFGNREELYAHLLRYADGETAEAVRASKGRPRYRYDWALNSP